jgi:citrate lyase beta subunit
MSSVPETLPPELTAAVRARLAEAGRAFSACYPGERPDRQPVHTVYGGAHLFKPDIVDRLRRVALATFEAQAPTPEALAALFGLPPHVAARVHPRVREKLAREPVEDLRIDFEDGYGHRPDAEEDAHAVAAARALAEAHAAGLLPPFIGLRIKSLGGGSAARAIRTLDLFLTSLVTASSADPGSAAPSLPPGLVVTLPKVLHPEEVSVLTDLLDALEARLGLSPGSIAVELMVETPQAILDPDGRAALPGLVAAGRGRVRGCHFGTYDYTASLHVTAASQAMNHPACDFALHMMQVSLAGRGVWLSDGATTAMPVPVHRAGPGAALTRTEEAENASAIARALRLAYDNVRRGLVRGLYQGWDLHPGQLVARHTAVAAFFAEGLAPATARLRNFLEAAARATRVGDAFDDAATGQGLLNHFLRGVHAGALDADDLRRAGLDPVDLGERSFVALVSRQVRGEGAD